MSTSIESLELEIKSSSQSAVSGIEALATSLGKLKAATSGGLGLNSVAKNLTSIKTAVDNMGNITNKLNGLSRAVNELTKLGNVKISASVGNQITKIGTALSTLDIGDGANKINELVGALKPLETLGKSSLSTTVNALNKLPEALQKIDMRKLHGQVDDLTRTFRPLAEEMQKIANGFNAFPSRIQRLIRDNERLSQSNNKTSTSYINLWAKMRIAYNTIKTGARLISSAISKTNDYIENVNLFNVSMGDYAKEAGEYAERVGEIMGIDPGEWMRNQGVFMTLATGFGVVSDRAYIMSKNLTQLGYDISSFFNIPYEDAMQKLQSGLAGELEPLRRIGYDLSQARLQQEAYTLGIDKKLSKMTQAEKAELRYYAILKQVTTSHGDMARTLDAPANQLRVLSAQVTQAARAIGSIFIPALNAVLPYVIAVTKVVRLLAETIASLFGFEMPDVDYTGVGSLASGAEDASDALGGAADNAKKLKQYTMGFDELNVIDPNNGSSGSNSGSGIGGSGFDFELPEYDFLGDLSESRVATIVEEMKEWLGLTSEINSWSDFFDTNLGQILILVTEIGVAIAGWKLTTGLITGVSSLLKSLKGLGGLAKGATVALGATVAITGLTIEWTGIIDAIRNGLDTLNFAEIIGGGSAVVAGGAIIGKALGSAVLGAAIGAIVAGVPAFFVGIYDACVNGLNWLNGLLIPAGATAAGAGIGAIIGMLGGPIGAGVGALVGLAIGALTDLIIWIVQEWGTIGEWFSNNVIQPICNFFSGLWSTVSGFFVNLWNDIVGVWKPVAKWFDTTVIKPISDSFSKVTSWIGTFFEGCWIIVQAAWIIASTWFDENVVEPIRTFFSGLCEDVSEFFSNLWKDIASIWKQASNWFDVNVIQPVTELFRTLWNNIKGIWGVVSTWFSEKVITPIKNAWEFATTKIGEFFTTLWAGIKSGVVDAMNAVIGCIESAINWVIRGLNKLIEGFNDVVEAAAEVVGTEWGGLSKIPIVRLERISKFEYGGFPETGQMFIAREAGAEMVGSIGRRTAVANNDQIVAGIASGVAEANNESNSLLREQNTLLRAMLEKESGVYLDGKSITKSVEKHQRERGRVLVTGGAY